MSTVTQETLSGAGKVIAVHVNYRSRAAQRGTTPELPSYFLKPSSSLALSGAVVERPAGCELLAFEGEVALIIGATARRVAPAAAWEHVGFITAANDFGVYDLKYADKGSNLRSKGGDGFTPLGHFLLDARHIDPDRLELRTWLNGTLVQDDTTAGLLFPFSQLVADLSQLMTLHLGDIILTGTPAGSSVAVPGDVLEVSVVDPASGESTGRLRTTVTEGSRPFADYGFAPRASAADLLAAWGNVAGHPPATGAALSPQAAPGELEPRTKAMLLAVGTATLSAQLRKRGLNNMSLDGLRTTQPGAKVVGTARTLRFVPNREDLFASHGTGFNAQKQAFDALGPGEVLVIEARGDPGAGTLGDILALRAQLGGAAALVTDGGLRDVAAVTSLGIPTFHGGGHPAVLGRRHVPWDAGLTIACAGATVQPGDIIVADADGIVVIPPALATELASDALGQEHEELFIAAMVARGHGLAGLYPMGETWRAKYATWAAEHPMAEFP